MIHPRAQEISDLSIPANPKVSVSLITYNQEEFIAAAIEGVLMQRTDFPYELVIGEDCSTDNTRRIVLAYQQEYPEKIRVLLQPRNTRGYGNYSETTEACRGRYIAELDGDDYWIDPLKLQSQAEMLDANPAAFICGARAQVWRRGAKAPSEITPAQDAVTLSAYGARELFESKWWFRTCTKMYPRLLRQSVPHRFQNDWGGTLWLIAKTNFGPVCFLDRVVGVYREHAGGFWSSMPPHGQAAWDVGVLASLVPVFGGADREYLKAQLTKTVVELMGMEEAPPFTKVKCASLAVLRCPDDPAAWSRLAASIQLAAGSWRRSASRD